MAEGDIFLDTHSIGGGKKFDTSIHAALKRTKVFICMIGPSWIKASNVSSHKRRLDEKDDHVRREIEIALREEDIHVIPVLVEGAQIIAAELLPETISDLFDHNAISIDPDTPQNGLQKLTKTVLSYLEGD